MGNIRTIIITITGIGIIYTGIIVGYGLKNHIFIADTGVILGNQVLPSGVPSERLKARLDKGFELFMAGTVKTLIVSGGLGKEGYQEAFVMRQYLIDKGVPEDKIFTDTDGNTTIDTARNGYSICQSHDHKTAIIVSQYYHILRTKIAFTKAGFDPDKTGTASADYFEIRDLYSIFRELFAIPKYLLWY